MSPSSLVPIGSVSASPSYRLSVLASLGSWPLSTPRAPIPFTRTGASSGLVCQVSLASSALPWHIWARARKSGLSCVPCDLSSTSKPLKHISRFVVCVFRGLSASIIPTHRFLIFLLRFRKGIATPWAIRFQHSYHVTRLSRALTTLSTSIPPSAPPSAETFVCVVA